MEELRVRVEPTEHGLRVVPSGVLDAVFAAQVRGPLLRSVAEADVEVDLADVPFIDSAGLTVLVAANNAARRGGRSLRVTGVLPNVMRLLLITELHKTLDIEPAAGPEAPGG